MKRSDAIRLYGKKSWAKMLKTGYLDGITVTLTDGEDDIPESDLNRAYRASKVERLHPLDWD
jgi:hypothetical protein